MTTSLTTFAATDFAAIAAWGAARPHGLRLDMTGDHDHFGYVLELLRGDPTLPLYFVAPLRPGGLEVNPGSARRDAFHAVTGLGVTVVADVAAARALVERVELRALGIE